MSASPPDSKRRATNDDPVARAPYVAPSLEWHGVYASVICASPICVGPGCFGTLPGFGDEVE